MNKRQGIANIPKICTRHDMKYVVISPGSRNAPLIYAFSRTSEIICISILDERSAAFYALGLAQYSQSPTGILCTSGTAILNYGPAIAEAYYQNLPLVVFTADRPKEWIDQYDNQTIRQSNIYGNYIKKSYELPIESTTIDDLWYSDRIVSEAIDFSVQPAQGPVHINIPLREPLYEDLPEPSQNLKTIHSIASQQNISDENLQNLRIKWNQYKIKWILCGSGYYNLQLNDALKKLSDDKSVLIVAENISNLFIDNAVYCPESFIASLSYREKVFFRPDLLITFGHSIVSKHLKQYLRDFPPKAHWHLDSTSRYIDTYKNLRKIIVSDPAKFFYAITNEKVNTKISLHEKIKEKKLNIQRGQEQFLKNVPFSDLLAYQIIISKLPVNSILHLANSTPIRYSQLFDTRKEIEYFSNRGTSGIDGCVSTAVGSAIASGKVTTLIVGDIAFLYDSNALINKHLPENLKIIVINNCGGNIFRLLDTGKVGEKIGSYQETPHDVNIKELTSAYDVRYFHCNNKGDLGSILKEFYSLSNAAILEIETDVEMNKKVFKDFFISLKK